MYTNVCFLYTPFVRINLELVYPAQPVLPYPFRQHRFINPIHGNCILGMTHPEEPLEPLEPQLWTLYVKLLHKVLLCFHLLIVINFCLSVLCIKSDFCIYHISKQVSTIATFVGDSSGCKLRRQLRLRRRLRLRVWIIAVPQKTSKDEHNLHGCIHWTPLQEKWNTLLILHISASKTKCRQETTETTKFALVIVIDCYGS